MYVISMTMGQKKKKKPQLLWKLWISKYQEQLKKRYDYDNIFATFKEAYFIFFAGISEEGPILVDIIATYMSVGTTDGGKSVLTFQSNLLSPFLISSGKYLRSLN